MVLSYSAAASSSSAPQTTTSGASSNDVLVAEQHDSHFPPPSTQPIASTSTSTSSQPTTATKTSQPTQIQHLILDAGPFLSLTPLRNLATTLYTTPAVIGELRDPKVREYFRNLPLNGVEVKIQSPRAESLAKVMAFAKMTGDYAVLSGTDLGVVALTLELEVGVNGEGGIRFEPPSTRGRGGEGVTSQHKEALAHGEGYDSLVVEAADEEAERDDLEEGQEDDETEEIQNDDDAGEEDTTHEESETAKSTGEPPNTTSQSKAELTSAPDRDTPKQDDDPDSDGEWITPKNLSHHRNHDLGLLPSENNNTSSASAPLAAACMTGDFAVQNVLLGMGLGLVGEGGKRISKVKSFVLRCHACFKICKDPSRKFCPSCGNPSLLRTTTTTSSTGHVRIHLKKNFQYQLRGTKFTIPDAKPGRAKGQEKGGSGLILREDQREWVDAVRMERGRVEKEERRVNKGVLGGWEDPDWLPEIISTGANGKGRSGGPGGMPTVGHGRKNPNQARRKR